MRPARLAFIQLWLALSAYSSAVRLLPRQLNVSNSDFAITAQVSTTSNAYSCCWIYPGQRGVRFETWYESAVTQYTATVVTTFVQYAHTVIVGNVSTTYMPTNDVYNYFGDSFDGVDLPGVPTDLLGDQLRAAEYAATNIFRSNETAAVLTARGITIRSPTPYLLFPFITIYATPAPARSLCGTDYVFTYAAQSGDSWTSTTRTEHVPRQDSSGMPQGFVPRDGDFHDHTLDYAFARGFDEEFGTAIPVRAALPNSILFLPLPEGVSESIVANKTRLSLSPWLTDCWTLGAEGQPTVKIQMNQLTSTASITITAADNATPQPVPVPTTLPVSTYTPRQTAVHETEPLTSPVETAIVPVPDGFNSANSPSHANPKTNQASTDHVISTTSPRAGADDVLQGDSIALITIGDTRASLQVGSAAVIVAGVTLAANSPAAMIDGHTLSLVGQASGLAAIVVDGTLTQTLRTPAAHETITAGGQTLTVAAGTSAILVDGTTIQPGQANIVKGQTFSLAGTNIVIAGSGTTTTQGLGGAIISGIGGGRGVTYTGLASKHVATNMIGVVLGLVALFV